MYISDASKNREERGKPAELGQWSKTSQRKGYVSRIPDRCIGVGQWRREEEEF